MNTTLVLAILFVLAIVVILIFFGRREVPIREVIVREEVPVAWLPWSWGYGWGGWSGTTYVDRPVPRFPWPRQGGHTGYHTGRTGGHGLPSPPSGGRHGGGGHR